MLVNKKYVTNFEGMVNFWIFSKQSTENFNDSSLQLIKKLLLQKEFPQVIFEMLI